MSKNPIHESSRTHTEAEALIQSFREQKWTEEEIIRDLMGLKDGTPPWRAELLWALTQANGIPLQALYAAIGVGPARVMARRRHDPELEKAIQDYLGAYFEDEAQLPRRDIKAGVLLAGLENHAHGWKASAQRNLTDEDLQKIIRAIVDSVRTRIQDPETLKLIGEDIAATLARFTHQAQNPAPAQS